MGPAHAPETLQPNPQPTGTVTHSQAPQDTPARLQRQKAVHTHTHTHTRQIKQKKKRGMAQGSTCTGPLQTTSRHTVATDQRRQGQVTRCEPWRGAREHGAKLKHPKHPVPTTRVSDSAQASQRQAARRSRSQQQRQQWRQRPRHPTPFTATHPPAYSRSPSS
jgi:hypothetical protein